MPRKALHGGERRCVAWLGGAGLGPARCGWDRQGKARQGKVFLKDKNDINC